MLKQYIQESIQEYKAPKKSCSCGCGGCSETQPKLALLESKAPISEGLRYHIENGISLQENVFRIGSKKYLQLFAEARMLLEWGTISLDENSKFLIENTDIGKFGVYEGKKVPLDLPIELSEEEIQEIYNVYESKILKNGDKYLGYSASEQIYYVKDSKTGRKVKHTENAMSQLYGIDWKEQIDEAEYQGKEVEIGKPKRGGSKAYYVYVMDGDKVKKVSFGSGGLRAKIKDPKARQAFAKRHNCDQKKDRTTPGYWSCNLPRYAPALGLGSKMNTYW